jgi:hypothetical protein
MGLMQEKEEKSATFPYKQTLGRFPLTNLLPTNYSKTIISFIQHVQVLVSKSQSKLKTSNDGSVIQSNF